MTSFASTYAVDLAAHPSHGAVDGYPAGGCTPAVPGHLALPCRPSLRRGIKLPEAASLIHERSKSGLLAASGPTSPEASSGRLAQQRLAFGLHVPAGEQRLAGHRVIAPAGTPHLSIRALSNGRRA